MTTRARKQGVLVNVNWADIPGKPQNIGADQVTYENLNLNGAVGSGATQVAAGNHDHEIGDVTLLFENQLI